VHLVELPHPIAAFRSITSPDSPFESLLKFVAHEVGAPDLSHSDLAISRLDWAELRSQTSRWLSFREGNNARLDELSRPGFSAPHHSSRVAPGHVEVA
jgi:hypothetical protein